MGKIRKQIIIASIFLLIIFSLCHAQETTSGSLQTPVDTAVTQDTTAKETAADTPSADIVTAPEEDAVKAADSEETQTTDAATTEDSPSDTDSLLSGGDPSVDTYRPYIHSPVSPGEKFSTNGFFDTSLFTGAATYTYQVQVPPGTNGMSPSVFLTYNSQGANSRPSIVGSGWSLSDNYIQRKANYTFYDSSDDEFTLVLNGASYDLIYVASENRFHTKIESYMFIQNVTGGNNTNSMYWILKTSDGTNYRFGYSNNSEMISSMYSYGWRWSLDLINDTHGNQIYYDYYENIGVNDSSAVYPKTIKYNLDISRKVEFVYEASDRPDIWMAYSEGTKLKETRRLKEISVTANNALVNRYYFQYTSLTDSLSSISNITRYGSDNSTSLSPVKFEYFGETKGWVESTSWRLPNETSTNDVTFTDNQNHYDRGRWLADINRDGFVDIVASENKSDGTTFRKIWINNGTGWENNSVWNIQDPGSTNNLFITFVNTGIVSSERGVRLDDVNNDGLIDITYSDSINNIIWTNNGTGWERNANYSVPSGYSFIDSRGDLGLRSTDMDGDAYPDLLYGLQYDECPSHELVFHSIKGTWTTDTNWFLPNINYSGYCDVRFAYINNNHVSSDFGRELADINGDGHPDIVVGRNNLGISLNQCDLDIGAYVNNGSSWYNETNWNYVKDTGICGPVFVSGYDTFVRDGGTRLADVNGDGLTDLAIGTDNPDGSTTTKVYLNSGKGWTLDSNWQLPINATFIIVVSNTTSYDKGTRFADVDGDGLVDLVKGEINSSGRVVQKIWINQAKKSHMLKRITNEMGGVTDIDYVPSTSLITVNESGHGNMGFNIWVVGNVTMNNSMSGSQNSLVRTIYSYDDPLYDSSDKEYRGFNYAKVTQADGSYSEHYFHQDDARKGREYETDARKSTGTLMKMSESDWQNETTDGYFVVNLIMASEQDYEGLSSSKTRNTTYDYDLFGNVLEAFSFGQTGLTGDSKHEVYRYLNNSAKWIVNKPKSYTLKDTLNSTIVRETYFRYDNKSYGTVPTKGDLTWKEDYYSDGADPVTRYEYDSYGNAILVYDPTNNTMQSVFGTRDTTYTFPDKVINSKGHTVNSYFDLGTGNMLSQIDSNGINTSFYYDTFGRKTIELHPYDTFNRPTTAITYTFDGTAPESIETLQRKDTNVSFSQYNTFTYYDGFGNVVQTKKEEDQKRQVELDVYYDASGRISKQSNPYFVSYNSSYSTPNTSVKGINYTYDALNRVIKILNPDSTYKTINFSRWNVTTFDENGNKKQYLLDAYDRIINVYEFNSGSLYRTNYTYDTADELTQIRDNLGNTINFTYDSLGRKTQLSDPDLGVWNYNYDALGNLVKQTDGNGKNITLTYDSLNRVTLKNASGVAVTYTYDTNANGTLFKIGNSYGEKNFTYDNRYRVTRQQEKRFGITFTTNYTYDSMDRVNQKIMPNGVVITYNYSNNTQLFSMSNVLTNVTYNELGLPLRRKYVSGIDSNFTYNTTNLRLSAIKTSNLQDFSYGYDSVGNVLRIVDSSNSRNYTMTYDDLDRLLTADLTNSSMSLWSFTYTYDSIGNILTANSLDGNMAYSYSSPVHAPYQIITS